MYFKTLIKPILTEDGNSSGKKISMLSLFLKIVIKILLKMQLSQNLMLKLLKFQQ